jgi:Holliday junction DNA helicase RuvB
MLVRDLKSFCGMSPCIDIVPWKFEVTPSLRHMLEPLVLDALFEHAARQRSLNRESGVTSTLPLSVAYEVLAAQEPRWQERLGTALHALGEPTRQMPVALDRWGEQLIQAAHEFCRREGASTVRAASARTKPQSRFALLWQDLFDRCVHEWLRDHDLMEDAEHLDVTDALVEGTKLWASDLVHGLNPTTNLFLDPNQNLCVTFERGPVKLVVQGRPDPAMVQVKAHGFELHQHGWAESMPVEVRVVQALLLALLLEQDRQAPCTLNDLMLVRPLAIKSSTDTSDSVSTAFAAFYGNATTVRRMQKRAKATAVENLLLTGPVGSGKMELARCLARAMNQPLIHLNSSTLKSVEDVLAAIDRQLTAESQALQKHDEAHRTYPPLVLCFARAHDLGRCSEALLPLLDVKQRRLGDALFPTSTVLATSDEPVFLSPAFARSCRRVELDLYSVPELTPLVTTVFTSAKLSLPLALAQLLVRLGRCLPGRVLKFAYEFRDHHLAAPHNVPLTRDAIMRLARFEWQVDEQGLEESDYHLLRALESGPKGLPALQQLLPAGCSIIAARAEPWLLQLGAIQRGPRGRALTVFGEQLLLRRAQSA